MSNPVIFFIREHLNGYVILGIIILFIYFSFLRRKYQKEAFQSYMSNNQMGLSSHRNIDNTGDKISKSNRKAFIKKHSVKKKREIENKKHAEKVKFLTEQEKKMQKQHKRVIKQNEAYNKEVLKNQVKKEVNEIKKMAEDQNLGELLKVQENFTNQPIKNKSINDYSNNNNNIIKKSTSKNINNFQNTNNSSNIILNLKNIPITVNDNQSKLINNFINKDIMPKLEKDFDKIKLQNIGIVKFSEEYDNILTKNSKKVMDYMFDNIITVKNDLETLITVENKKRIFYNTVIIDAIKKHLKSLVENYINSKINLLQNTLGNKISKFNEELDNRDVKLKDIHTLRDKLNISLNQYQYVYGKKVDNQELSKVLTQLQKMNIQPEYETEYDINNSMIQQQFDGDESLLAKDMVEHMKTILGMKKRKDVSKPW